MHKITIAQTNHVLTLLESSTTVAKISEELDLSLGTISCICVQHCSNLPQSSEGCPAKLSSANNDYTRHVIHMGKVDNTVQMAKVLQNVTN